MMMQVLIEITLFAAKTFILLLFFIALLVVFFALLHKGKKQKGRIQVKNINHRYDETKEVIMHEMLSKKELKQFYKQQKAQHKAQDKLERKNIYVINFQGDIKASAVEGLREEITAILNAPENVEEVIVKIESAGGVVHGYGLAAAQLMRIRDRNIPLTVTIDKIAASGGYMMACIGNKILAAPFAIIGSIGVVVQLPNFNRLLRDKHIDFEQFTAGEFKRTVTIFGKNTQEGRKKLQTEIEEVHQLFKDLIIQHRPHLHIDKIATGEHWVGIQAKDLNLVDDLQTSDDYILERSKTANIYEICFEVKKPMLQRLLGAQSHSSAINLMAKPEADIWNKTSPL